MSFLKHLMFKDQTDDYDYGELTLSSMRNLKFRTKFMIMGGLFLFAAIISLGGMFEISQTRIFVSFERDHMQYSTFLNFRGKEYIKLVKKGTRESLGKAQKIMTSRNKKVKDMGIVQLAKELIAQPKKLFDKTNKVQEIFFNIISYGRAFDLANKDIRDGEALLRVCLDFKGGGKIVEFEKQFFKHLHEIEQNGALLTPLITSLSSLIRKSVFTSSLFILVLAVISLYSLARMTLDPLRKVTAHARKLAEGDLNQKIDIRQKDEIGQLSIALNRMTINLREAMVENEKQYWFKTGQTDLNNTIRGEQDIITLAQNIISWLARFLNAQLGVLYVSDEDRMLKIAGSFAYQERKNHSSQIRFGEGLAGQAAIEQKELLFTNVPEDYIKVSSGLGESLPHYILDMPIILNGKVNGVIELGIFEKFTDNQTEFLKQACESIAIAIEAAQSRSRMNVLLDSSQRQTEELQSQQEELQAANDELTEKTTKLLQSESELKAQQEELQATNEELEEKTESLERQKSEIIKKNVDLENARQDIEQKAKELEITSKYKSEFLANMSHELRTPLNSLLLLSRHLTENKDGNLSDDQIESAQIIYNGGNDLLSLINEILDLSKIESGRISINLKSVRIDAVSESIKNGSKHLIEEKGLTFKFNLSDGIPDAILTDQQRMEQIIKNMISNAIKFTEKGGITVNFYRPPSDVDLTRSGLDYSKAIAVSVKDTGIGIPKDKQLEIFEAFQQADGSTSRQYGGTGLGLSISRELAKLLGGEIQLYSIEEKGATFTLYLPEKLDEGELYEKKIIPERRKRPYGYHSSKNAASSDFSQSKLKTEATAISDDRDEIKENDRVILVIEDDLNFARVLSKLCNERGLKFIHAGDGETGLKVAEEYKVSAIILDINLPGIGGLSVLEILKNRSNTRHIPVHMMSVYEENINAFKMGAVGYLTKPVTTVQLEGTFSKIESLIAKDIKDLLIVEDDENLRMSIKKLIGNGDVNSTTTGSGKEALDLLRSKTFDCMILDLTLPDMSGFEVLKEMGESKEIFKPPIIIYTGKELTPEEDFELHKYAESIIIKSARSEERLLDETALFLHRVIDKMPEKTKKMISRLHDEDKFFHGKKILIVDDDMRNVFALSKLLKEKGLIVQKAANGEDALTLLSKEEGIDLVLMDIMMPVMDGYECMRRIRAQKHFQSLPILALTAKAMKDDRENCILAGANDYIAKPVDIEVLMSLLRVWLY